MLNIGRYSRISSLLKRKRTIILSEELDEQIQRYIRERAIETIRDGGSIPSESQFFEELLATGLQTAKVRKNAK
jgi:hypothetical protein